LSAAYASSSSIDSAAASLSLSMRRAAKLAQSVIPIIAFVSIWLTRPAYFEVGVAFAGAIWIKHLLFDQIGLRA
jgi:hypothetical protein